MRRLKALGIDGVHAFFFQKHWSVVGESICDLVRKIFDGGSVDSDICRTLIILIPKKDNPESFNQFRPISHCNKIYEIITKIIAKSVQIDYE